MTTPPEQIAAKPAIERRRSTPGTDAVKTLSREARIVVWILAVAVFLFVVRLLQPILLPFLAGMAIAYFLDPIATRLQRLGMSRPLATLVITLGFFALAVIIVVLLAPIVSDQIGEFAQKLPDDLQKILDRAQPLWRSAKHYLSPKDLDKLKSAAGDYAGTMAGWLGTFLSQIVTESLVVVSVLSVVIITPVVTFYLLRDWHRLTSLVDKYLPRNQAETIREQFREIDRTLAGFIRGQALVCLSLGCIYGIGLTVIGLDLGLLVGVIAGGLSFVPYLGTLTGLVAAIILALAQSQGWDMVLEVVGIFVVGNVLEGYVLAPRLVGSKVGLHPVWMIFAILAGGTLFGFVGILLAVPVTAVIGVLVRFTLESYVHSSLYEHEPDS
jgi:predicted PurR-regulated permease PerM